MYIALNLHCLTVSFIIPSAQLFSIVILVEGFWCPISMSARRSDTALQSTLCCSGLCFCGRADNWRDDRTVDLDVTVDWWCAISVMCWNFCEEKLSSCP